MTGQAMAPTPQARRSIKRGDAKVAPFYVVTIGPFEVSRYQCRRRRVGREPNEPEFPPGTLAKALAPLRCVAALPLLAVAGGPHEPKISAPLLPK
jgi:hypothetical protein